MYVANKKQNIKLKLMLINFTWAVLLTITKHSLIVQMTQNND